MNIISNNQKQCYRKSRSKYGIDDVTEDHIF